MKSSFKKLMLCILVIACLCVVQIMNNSLLILGCLVLFLIFAGWNCTKNFSFPILLFFLPWAPLLKAGVGSTSFYTLALILICGITWIKRDYCCKPYQIVIVLFLVTLSLSAKLIDGNGIDNSYILFMILIFLFPSVKEELKFKTYDFKQCIIFFCIGIISAAIMANELSEYVNIAKYVTVHTIRTIVRLSGFYGDPNFYAAHIAAAIAGCLILFLHAKNKKEYVGLSILVVVLLYCGMLSGSKTFVIIMAVIIGLWMIEIMLMNNKVSHKWAICVCVGLGFAFIVKSVEFNELIAIQVERFSNANNISNLTTGRSDLWIMYLNEITHNFKLMLIGEGFTNVLIQGRASHNTLIQIVYQFGIIGGSALLIWVLLFFKDNTRKGRLKHNNYIKHLILILGIFSYWLALDVLYFDEFFLMFMLFYMGRDYIEGKTRQES